MILMEIIFLIHLMAMTMGIQFQTQTTIALRAVCLIL